MTIPTRCGGASWSDEKKAAYRAKKAKAEQELQEIIKEWIKETEGTK